MNDCDLSALVCDDQDQTITNFVEQKGIITSFIYGGIRAATPMIRLLEGTKKLFPEGMGDSLRRDILEVTSPNELDGLDWNPVRSNFPGNSACCNEYRTFTYGSRSVSGCLSQIGYKSPSFCKTDIVFKTKFMDQLMQIMMAMRNVTVGVWDNWLKASYQKTVYNTILSAVWKHPEQLGQYPSAARPTTFLTVEHLDAINERIVNAAGNIGTPIKGYQVLVIGRNQFNRLKMRRMEQNASLMGARSAEFSLPGYNEFNIEDLGKVVTFSNYAFLVIDKPRRFREKTTGQSWDDAIIPSTINVQTDKGFRTDRNPDYFNPDIALYEETLWHNLEAVEWLIPPAALSGAITSDGKQWFPATNYAGDFEAIYCPEDPKKKTVQFMADFMGGMMSLFPQKGRALLHYACHISACDDDDQVCLVGAPQDVLAGNAIRQVGTTLTAGQLQILVTGTLPEACPDGYSLFMETEKGERYIVGSVGSPTAFPGNSTFPQPGNYYTVTFPSALNSIATVRELCDPWKRIVCLPNVTPSNDPAVTVCGVCNNDTTPPSETCVLTAVVEAEIIRGLLDSDQSATISTTNYTSASTLQSAINTYLGTHGGGTAVVTKDGFTWTIQITGATAYIGGAVVYDDGIVNTNEQVFGQTGVCTAT